ncbi:MAG: hypothetical protein A2512_02005 [Deltaproteobacteria bacterium RIFOXYD12_FULL_56_24]|nr:MAG: hypothetical protein A2512_02005 [Deltaproteobacteria bacterium RIFOXYD12_FULL_56_24]
MSKLFDAIERIRHNEAGNAVISQPDEIRETLISPQNEAANTVASPTDIAKEAVASAEDEASKIVVAPRDQTDKDLASPLPMPPPRRLWGKGKTQQPAEKSRRSALIIRLTFAISLLATISWYVFPGTMPTISSNSGRRMAKDGPVALIPTPALPKPVLPEETSTKPPASAPKEPAPAVIPRNMAELNNRGVELVADNDLWRGLYYFDLARLADPMAVEPLINMGVTLSELGLFAPAVRIFKEAHAMAPNHPDLRYNLENLAGRGLDKL